LKNIVYKEPLTTQENIWQRIIITDITSDTIQKHHSLLFDNRETALMLLFMTLNIPYNKVKY